MKSNSRLNENFIHNLSFHSRSYVRNLGNGDLVQSTLEFLIMTPSEGLNMMKLGLSDELSGGVESRHAIKQEQGPCRRPSDMRTEGDNWGGGPKEEVRAEKAGGTRLQTATLDNSEVTAQITKRAASVDSGVRRIGAALELSSRISDRPAQFITPTDNGLFCLALSAGESGIGHAIAQLNNIFLRAGEKYNLEIKETEPEKKPTGPME